MEPTTGGDSERLLADLAPHAVTRSLQLGEILVAEGEHADEVFVVVSGCLDATTATRQGETRVGTIRAGEVAGEITTIAGGRRTATLRAAAPTVLKVIARPDFERFLTANPAIANEISARARDRIDRVQLVTMLTGVLGATDPELVNELVERVAWLRLEAGATLFEQGDASDAAYFVVGGRLAVFLQEDGDERLIRELPRGEVVGELGLLDRAPRSATVRAVRDTTLASFATATFEDLVSRYPDLMLSVARSLLTRLHNGVRTRPLDRATSFAVAVTARGAPDDLTEQIAVEVSRFGSVRLLSSERVDRWLGRTGISQVPSDNVDIPRLAEFMHEAEVGNDHIVLEADPDVTPWTSRVLRQADRIVVVASPSPDAEERRRIEAILADVAERRHIHRMLAVVHPPGTDRPRGSARLVSDLGVDEIVHVRADSAADVARLARLASGHGVGLVLSGGGARGFAHIGVFEALRSVGVPVDSLGSCSIGAPLSAGMAMGLAGDELLDVTEHQFRRLLDYTLPVVALLKGERISRNLSSTFDTWDFEDLWLPCYCVSTNLTRSRLEVHRRGDVARAVRASVALPGVLPPVPYDGDLLVDGGVLDNLPVEAMRSDPTIGTVIAVDVAPRTGPRAKSDFGMSVSGPRALVAMVRRQSIFPSATAILMRSMIAGAVQNQQRALKEVAVDLLVRLSLPGISLLQFDAVRPVAQAGFDGSLEQVRDWAAGQTWLAAPGDPQSRGRSDNDIVQLSENTI